MILLANTTTIIIFFFQINSTTVDACSDDLFSPKSKKKAMGASLAWLTVKPKEKTSEKKRRTVRKKKERKKKEPILVFSKLKREPKYNWVQGLRAESKIVRCVYFMILACACAVAPSNRVRCIHTVAIHARPRFPNRRKKHQNPGR